MQQPLSYRHSIPFYIEKSAAEYQKDQYERYDPMVIRQTKNHLVDHLWNYSPFGSIYTFAEAHYPTTPLTNILDIGCGVGRWIGDLAMRYPQAESWGIDYSYQMLKQANLYWKSSTQVSLDLSSKGFPELIILDGQQLSNLNLGLAKANNLPFDNKSQDLVVSSFLLDRLDDPLAGLKEMHRVLRPNGTIIVATPLNYTRAELWDTFYPPEKLKAAFIDIGFDITDWKTDILLHEPIDFHGNAVRWKCCCIAARKF